MLPVVWQLVECVLSGEGGTNIIIDADASVLAAAALFTTECTLINNIEVFGGYTAEWQLAAGNLSNQFSTLAITLPQACTCPDQSLLTVGFLKSVLTAVNDLQKQNPNSEGRLSRSLNLQQLRYRSLKLNC